MLRRILSVLVVVALLGAFSVGPLAAREPPSLKKMTKKPIGLCHKKVGELYLGKCAAEDATKCCYPPKERCRRCK